MRKPGLEDGQRGTLWDLKPEAASQYDPNFPRLARADHERATERVVALRAKAGAGAVAPLVGPPPPCHPAFAPVRAGILRSCRTDLRSMRP